MLYAFACKNAIHRTQAGYLLGQLAEIIPSHTRSVYARLKPRTDLAALELVLLSYPARTYLGRFVCVL